MKVVASRGPGEAGSGSNLCGVLTVCAGSRGPGSLPGPQRASRSCSASASCSPRGAPLRPGLVARVSFQACGSGTAAASRGRSHHGKPGGGARRLTPCFGLTRSRDLESPAASDSGDSEGWAGAGATGRRRGGATSQPETNRQLIPELSSHLPGRLTTGPAHTPRASRATSSCFPCAQRAHPPSCTRSPAKTRMPLAITPIHRYAATGTARSEAQLAASFIHARQLDPKGCQRHAECTGFAGKSDWESGGRGSDSSLSHLVV